MPENLVDRNSINPTKKALQIIVIIIIVFSMNKIHAESLDERLTNPTTQKEAIKELWGKGDSAIPELKEMLKSENKEIIMIALVRLHDLKNKEAVPEVTEILNKGDLELEMKKIAMQYLCLIKDKNVISVCPVSHYFN